MYISPLTLEEIDNSRRLNGSNIIGNDDNEESDFTIIINKIKEQVRYSC